MAQFGVRLPLLRGAAIRTGGEPAGLAATRKLSVLVLCLAEKDRQELPRSKAMVLALFLKKQADTRPLAFKCQPITSPPRHALERHTEARRRARPRPPSKALRGSPAGAFQTADFRAGRGFAASACGRGKALTKDNLCFTFRFQEPRGRMSSNTFRTARLE